jgi:hypothetical protein
MPAGDTGEDVVSIGDWLGVVSLVLAIPLGIASSLLTTRLVSYLEKRRLIKTHRTREQDLATYRNIESFKNGTRDKYASYIALAVFAVNFAICGATCLLLLLLKYGDLGETGLLPSQPTVFLFVLTFLFLLLSLVFIIVIMQTARRIERFDEYTAEIRKKWGDDAV